MESDGEEFQWISWSRFRQSQKYNDLTIVCGKYSFPVHKAILCLRSEYFSKACDSGFSEPSSGQIELQEHPLVVHAMLDYLYEFDYNSFWDYGCPMDVWPEDLKDGGEEEKEDDAVLGHLADIWLEIQLYILADCLLIDGLKQMSMMSVMNKLANQIILPTFHNLVVHTVAMVYQSTPPHDRELRKQIAEFVDKHLRAFETDAFKTLMRNLPDFMYDLTIELMTRRLRFGDGW